MDKTEDIHECWQNLSTDLFACVCWYLPPHIVSVLIDKHRGLRAYKRLFNYHVLPHRLEMNVIRLKTHLARRAVLEPARNIPIRIYDRDEKSVLETEGSWNAVGTCMPQFFIRHTEDEEELDRIDDLRSAVSHGEPIGEGRGVDGTTFYHFMNYVLRDRNVDAATQNAADFAKVHELVYLGVMYLREFRDRQFLHMEDVSFTLHSPVSTRLSLYLGKLILHGADKDYLIEIWETKRPFQPKKWKDMGPSCWRHNALLLGIRVPNFEMHNLTVRLQKLRENVDYVPPVRDPVTPDPTVDELTHRLEMLKRR